MTAVQLRQYLHDLHAYRSFRHASAPAVRAVLGGGAALQLYREVVYPAIAAPYVFSDHRNKPFARQYTFLRCRSPALWSQDWELAPRGAVARALAPTGLEPDICTHIAGLARVGADRAIIRAMAIANNVAFSMHSD